MRWCYYFSTKDKDTEEGTHRRLLSPSIHLFSLIVYIQTSCRHRFFLSHIWSNYQFHHYLNSYKPAATINPDSNPGDLFPNSLSSSIQILAIVRVCIMAAAAAEELPFDLFEEILKRLDVEDLLKCKSVCKSWKSFISNPCFVKAYMKHLYNNDRRNSAYIHRRISHVKPTKEGLKEVVGSCSGLVCFSSSSSSTTNVNDEFVVVNLSSGVVNKTATFRHLLDNCKLVCQGFGYDSSTRDYKVIAGFTSEEETRRILFYALALKSNVWKLIGELKYHRCVVYGEKGVFFDGVLHWFMYDANKRRKNISLDLSTEEFKEITQPSHEDYAPGHMKHQCYFEEHGCCRYMLGVLEECLSIYKVSRTSRGTIWVMKNNKWDPHGDCYFRTNDGQHKIHESCGYTLTGNGKLYNTSSVTRYTILVKSLVSPHPCVKNNDNYYEGQTMGIAKTGKKNKKRNKKRKRSCKRKTLCNKLLTWTSSSIFGLNKRFVLIPRSPMSRILIFMFFCLRLTFGYTYLV